MPADAFKTIQDTCPAAWRLTAIVILWVFMTGAPSDPMLDCILRYTRDACGAEIGRFYWIDPSARVTGVYGNSQLGDLEHVYWTVADKDPLAPAKLLSRKEKLAFLSDVRGDLARKEFAVFLEGYGLSDEADLLFCHKDRPVAGLALFKTIGQGRFAIDSQNW